MNINETGRTIAGLLLLFDTIMKSRGLEKTLEDIREVNKIHPGFKGMMDSSNHPVTLEAWKAAMASAAMVNKTQGRRSDNGEEENEDDSGHSDNRR